MTRPLSRRLALSLTAVTCLAVSPVFGGGQTAIAASPDVVLAEVYGGGG